MNDDLKIFEQLIPKLGDRLDIEIFNNIKLEAIKWIKELENYDNDFDWLKHLNCDLKVLNTFVSEEGDVFPTINFIKYFFNITEDDLKC
jgi:hypothetical protein